MDDTNERTGTAQEAPAPSSNARRLGKTTKDNGKITAERDDLSLG